MFGMLTVACLVCQRYAADGCRDVRTLQLFMCRTAGTMARSGEQVEGTMRNEDTTSERGNE